jgi:hypothetical protein
MDPRQRLSVPATLFFSLLIGCTRTPTTVVVEGSSSSGGDPATGAAADRAASAGLVGPGQTAERLEVADLPGPAAPLVVFTAGIKGYTEPCGCTLDLVLGGIDRVTGFARAAAALAPNALVLDAGNLLFEFPELDPASIQQEERKTQVIVAAARAMGVRATVPGPTDLARGLDFYQRALGGSGIEILASNITAAAGVPIGLDYIIEPVGTEQIAVIGAVDPELFAGHSEVETTPAFDAVQTAVRQARAEGATTTILLFQGDVVAARREFALVTGLDFIVIGNSPRETDEVTPIGSAFALEAYDQGRYVGRLKLVRSPDVYNMDWRNARAASASEVERLERLVAGIDTQLAGLAPSGSGEAEPPIVATLRARQATYREQLAAAEAAAVEFNPENSTFYYEPTPMSPGYPTDPGVTGAMETYNSELRAINMASGESPIPAAEGAPHYVGVAACATCHPAEHQQWLTTSHAQAIDTLVQREKEFDRNCIGCHVTGYREPGGTVLGHTEGLENVQCEQCHGPGSLHATNPTLVDVVGGVVSDPGESACVGCHSPEHSPRFNFGAYRPQMLGAGHGTGL